MINFFGSDSKGALFLLRLYKERKCKKDLWICLEIIDANVMQSRKSANPFLASTFHINAFNKYDSRETKGMQNDVNERTP